MSVSDIDDIYFARPGVPGSIHSTLLNGGPSTHDISITVDDSEGWQLNPANLSVAVNAIDSCDLALDVTPPQGASIGSATNVTVISQDDPSLEVVMSTKVVVPYEIFTPIVPR